MKIKSILRAYVTLSKDTDCEEKRPIDAVINQIKDEDEQKEEKPSRFKYNAPGDSDYLSSCSESQPQVPSKVERTQMTATDAVQGDGQSKLN